MVRKLTTTPRTRAWKALLATVVISGGLLWHILACLESPMAFSPDGKQLAFVTIYPSDIDNDLAIAGVHCYRLMVLRDFKKLEVIEQTTDKMLTAPAWSPDGKRICYLRIPLMTREELKKFKKTVKKRSKAFDMSAGAGPTTTPSAQKKDRLLPPLDTGLQLHRTAIVRPWPAMQVVVRDGRTFKLVSTKTVQLPLLHPDADMDGGLRGTYIFTRPQYGPDGKWVYLCIGDVAVAVDPDSGDHRLLATAATLGCLSPNGKTLATLGEKILGFVQTDGNLAVYKRLDVKPAPSQLFWKDNQTVAFLVEAKDPDPKLWFVRRDGTDAGSITLKLPKDRGEKVWLDLAFAPDAKHIVLCYGDRVFFLDATGKVLKQWQNEDEKMAQPVFTPDSRRVAIKHMRAEENEKGRVDEIVVFTPEGKEVARAKVPKIKPGTTRPATQPVEE